ncbi:MAG TPA: GIY-YIG nuclease family protein [Candidatus Aminicenantes bacterium]|nr:GIY-YIG nuclease family protein [Acidobacteriota bacterium]HOI45099.1 GIY-YIG nuclease family protein [Candidatus Aminicenantes bacterium]
MNVIYKVTYPNEKVYLGKDLTVTLNDFGSADSQSMEKDFAREQMRDFTIRKEILFESNQLTNEDISKLEADHIKTYRSNDPEIGYNRRPKHKNGKR